MQGRGRPAQYILPQFLTFTLLPLILFILFLYVLFDRKKHQKLSAQVSKLAYLATLVVKNSNKFGFNSLAQAFASRSRLLLVSYCVTSLIRLLLIARVLTFQSREQKNSLHALPTSHGAHAQTLLF